MNVEKLERYDPGKYSGFGKYVLHEAARAREDALLGVLKAYWIKHSCDYPTCALCQEADKLIRDIEASR